MSNPQLAHEIYLNANFRMEEGDDDDGEELVDNMISEVFNRAYWSSVADDLASDPPRLGSVLSLLEEIKGGVKSLSLCQPEWELIERLVDVERIRGQLRGRSLDFAACEALAEGIVGVVLAIHGRIGWAGRVQGEGAKWGEIKGAMVRAAWPSDKALALVGALEFVLDSLHKVRPAPSPPPASRRSP